MKIEIGTPMSIFNHTSQFVDPIIAWQDHILLQVTIVQGYKTLRYLFHDEIDALRVFINWSFISSSLFPFVSGRKNIPYNNPTLHIVE